MNCPQCGQPAKEIAQTAAIMIDGRNWAYKYREFVCERHARAAFQTEEQLQENLDNLRRCKEMAAKLKKAKP